MQLPLLICHLAITAAMPAIPSVTFERVLRILDTLNDTETSADYDYQRNQEQRICETEYCNEIAKTILQNRDTSVDPCEDFYRYACGSWEKYNPIPDNEVEWSENHIVMDKTFSRIRDALEKHDKPTDIPPVKMARKLYRSCMDVDSIERRGIKPIEEILDRTGGWPMAMPVEDWNPSEVPWQKIDRYYVRLIGNSAFYNLEIEVDTNNTKRYILTLDQDTEYPLANKRDVNQITHDVENYAVGIYRIVEAFAREKGYILGKRQIANDITKMAQFELDLSRIIENGKESHATSENYERMTIADLQKWYNRSGVNTPSAKINFLEVIQHVFKPANISVNASEPIMVYNPEFLHKLAVLLGNTSRRIIVNYIQWNMVNKFLPYTTQEMRDIKFNISFSSYNISNYTPRWKFCVHNVKMKNAVSYMFVKEHISDNVIHEARMMVHNIREELRHPINQSHWLPNTMKRSLTQKLDTITTKIGYPEWYKDDQAVIEYYKRLKIGADYFQNILNCEDDDLIRDLKKFKKPVERNQWLDYPITVNAFYVHSVNTIIIPAAELQDPYFTDFLPDAINYGTTGFVIGHELSHSFDNEGIQFDKEGYKIVWSSQKAHNAYEQQAECFVDQYESYVLNVTDQHGKRVTLDGRLTVNENIADSIGIQAAYSAFKRVTKHKIQTKLPGLGNVTDDELFFLSYANSWCASTRPEYETDIVNTDEHSPAMFRVTGSLSNMPAFSQTFKCSRNSSMNPRHKCNLWN